MCGKMPWCLSFWLGKTSLTEASKMPSLSDIVTIR